MSVFIDTNILLRIVQPNHPSHEKALSSVLKCILEGESLVVTPQIMAEFWNAATRLPEHNGLGFTYERANNELSRLEEFLTMLAESGDVYREWK